MQLSTRRKRQIISGGLLIVLDGLFFGLVDPTGSTSLVLFVGFALLAVNVYALFYVALRLFRQLTGRPLHSLRRICGAGTLVAVLLLALQSIGQLTIRDALALVVLCGAFFFYTTYYKFGQR